jgi:DNA-binding CsgD family transcriptional regulator
VAAGGGNARHQERELRRLAALRGLSPRGASVYPADMTGTELKRLLKRAGRSARGTAKALSINERTMRAYIADDLKIPRTVELALLYLVEHPEEAGEIPAAASARPSRAGR